MNYQLLYYDKIYIYAKNIEQSTYPDLTKTFKPISDEIGYDVFESRLNQDWIKIDPVNKTDASNKK